MNSPKRSASSESSSRKRPRDASSDPNREPGPSSKASVPSIFTRSKLKFQWLDMIENSCLHGINGDPTPGAKIAAFDIDGTLIKTKSGKTFPSNAEDWILWHASIPKKIKQVYEDGFVIVLISNQNHKAIKRKMDFEKKMKALAQVLDVPFRIFAAREKDRFRKPLTGMWDEFVASWNGDLEPDKELSYYVGDAAGRPQLGKTAKDWNDTDRKWALNVEIPFFTPEEFFLGQAPRTDFVLSGFNPKKYDHDQPVWHPSTTPLAHGPILASPVSKTQTSDISGQKLEIVLFVGPPAVGKTTLYNRHFAPRGYHHINQDKLKTFDKCLELVKETIRSGQPCVIDNTNPTQQTRSEYIKLARSTDQCQIRCIHFSSPIELARHNNLYRAFYRPRHEDERELLPDRAFDSYVERFEEPHLNEGFDELKIVNFVFDGSLDDRKRWGQYLV